MVRSGVVAGEAGITVPLALSDGNTAEHGPWLSKNSRRNQAEFVCNNPACGWEGNADLNAARTVLHRYRTGHALAPAAGRAVVRRASHGVKPATAR